MCFQFSRYPEWIWMEEKTWNLHMIGDLLFLQEVFFLVSPILYYGMGRHYSSWTFPIFTKSFMLMLEEHVFISSEWPPPDFFRIDQNVSPFFKSILGVMRSSHHHSWPCSLCVWWERHPRKMEVGIYRKSGICFTYSTSSISRFIWEKNDFRFYLLLWNSCTFTTVGRWFLRHLERITKSLPSSKLPQLARNRMPRLPLGEIHLHSLPHPRS